MSKVSNTLNMLRLLETGKKYSVSELANKLEVTPRMVKIYKEELEKCGIYIDTIKGRYGGYIYYHKPYNFEIRFDYLDVDAIESILDKLNEEERNKISITLEKLRSIVIYSADEKRNIIIDEKDLNDKYLIISKAIEKNQKSNFVYHEKIRNFIPYSFTYYKEFIYITGYSIDEDDIKTLNLSKIENLKIV